jgi:ABC-type hemin transport system ATPase subunit
VLLLDNGQIAARGAPPAVLQAEVLSKVYRCPLRIQVDKSRYYVRVDPTAWNSILD